MPGTGKRILMRPDTNATPSALTGCFFFSFSGKTSTISFVARLFAAHGKRVLVTSYTHAAVDALFLKLIEQENIMITEEYEHPSLVRLGTKSSCHASIFPYLATHLATQYEKLKIGATRENVDPSAEALQKIMTASHIVGVTALSCPRSPLICSQHFDVVIVDEAGQISQPATLGPLLSADTFVLAGDHMQLPPLVKSEDATKGGK
jgi:DNA replication ATP-dependent helicase Dna2